MSETTLNWAPVERLRPGLKDSVIRLIVDRDLRLRFQDDLRPQIERLVGQPFKGDMVIELHSDDSLGLDLPIDPMLVSAAQRDALPQAVQSVLEAMLKSSFPSQARLAESSVKGLRLLMPLTDVLSDEYELSDEELELVAGGTTSKCNPTCTDVGDPRYPNSSTT